MDQTVSEQRLIGSLSSADINRRVWLDGMGPLWRPGTLISVTHEQGETRVLLRHHQAKSERVEEYYCFPDGKCFVSVDLE